MRPHPVRIEVLSVVGTDHDDRGDQQADGSTPFFLFVNYMDAHLPYISPAHYRRMFMASDQVDRSYDLRQAHGNLVHAMDYRFNIEGPGFIPQADREILKLQYDAAIRLGDKSRRRYRGWTAISVRL